MRARNIKPAFFKDGKITQLEYQHRLLFVGLWCLSDREGYFRNNPREIKSEIFPDQPVDILEGLDALAAAGLIDLYSFDGTDYGHVLNFMRHQNPHRDEKSFGYPQSPNAPQKAKRGRPIKNNYETIKNELSGINSELSTINPPTKTITRKAPPVKEEKHRTSTVQTSYSHGANRADPLLMNEERGFPLNDPPKPDPNGNGNSELMELVIRLQEKYPSMAISTILGNHLNKPKEIKVLCITRMLEKATIHYPAQYLDNILDKESAKHYARLEEQKSNEIAQEEKAMILRLNESTQTFE